MWRQSYDAVSCATVAKRDAHAQTASSKVSTNAKAGTCLCVDILYILCITNT